MWSEEDLLLMVFESRGKVIVVSACLLGLRSRYDGKPLDSALVESILRHLRGIHFVAICPEQMGGFSTPRLPLEIESGSGDDVIDGRSRVIDSEGKDATKVLMLGANQALRVAQLSGARLALLKDGSPSCGTSFIKRGGKRVSGQGVAAALLRRAGIEVYGEDRIAVLMGRLT